MSSEPSSRSRHPAEQPPQLQEPRGRAPAVPSPAERRPLEMADLQARRRRARRTRKLARFDVALGAVVAVALLIASPGLAITAIVALLTLVVCLVSLLVTRRRRLWQHAPHGAGERRRGRALRGQRRGRADHAGPPRAR